MFPYQIYQALADQRINDLMAQARHHDLLVEARRHRTASAQLDGADASGQSSRLRNAVTHLVALAHGSARASTSETRATSTGTRATPTQASAPAAGPMGCIA